MVAKLKVSPDQLSLSLPASVSISVSPESTLSSKNNGEERERNNRNSHCYKIYPGELRGSLVCVSPAGSETRQPGPGFSLASISH